MTTEGDPPVNRRGEPRVPFDGAVRLRYRLFHEFLEENAANISAGGMFIRTIHPGERGSQLDFEIRLEDDFTLIEGRGEVAWVRRAGEEPGAAPGMGVRFLELAEASRALVERIVSERVAAGLELFDLDGQAPPPAERSRVVAPSEAEVAPIWELGAPGSGAATARAGEAGAEDDPKTAPPPAAVSPENLAALDPHLPPTQEARPAVPRPAAAAAGTGPAAGSRARPARLIALAVASALIGAGAVLTFHWLYVQPSIEALETRIDELAGRPGGPWQPPADEPEARAAGEAAGAQADPAAALSPPGREDEVIAALRGWAAAWSEQRVDDYLARYAAGFEPPDGLERAAWEAARRARIERPAWIRVALTHVQVEPGAADAAVVRFVQSYRSERYEDLVRKEVSMVRQDGAWKIAAERLAG